MRIRNRRRWDLRGERSRRRTTLFSRRPRGRPIDGNQLGRLEQPSPRGDRSRVDVEKQLTTLPFDSLVSFRFSRFGRAIEPFQSFAAWRPLASLVIDQDREWAFWTPAGYYDASFNGHQRFGWQINRGIERKPDFFRAAQFRAALERPDIMRRLLTEGSLPSAMRRSIGRRTPPPGQRAIVNQYRTKPTIAISCPRRGTRSSAATALTVVAEVTTPTGAAFAGPQRLRRRRSGDRGRANEDVLGSIGQSNHANLRVSISSALGSKSASRDCRRDGFRGRRPIHRSS